MRSLLPLPLLLVAVGCNSAGYKSAADTAGWERDYADTGWGSEAPSDENDDDGDGPDYGSEVEDDFLKLQPATTDRYVFVANPARNTVSRVTVSDLSVVTVDVGENPTVVLTSADYSRAATFNQTSDTVTVIEAESLDVTHVDVRENFNQMVMSPDSAWVVCYHDTDLEDDESQDGVSSFNEISIVNLATKEHVPIVVGFNPRQVQFADDGSFVVVISDETLAVLDLAGGDPGASVEIVEVVDAASDAPTAEEVVILPSNDYAFVRQYNVDDLVVVNLGTLEVGSVAAGLGLTDIDLSPDGSVAVAVARDEGALYLFDTERPYATPERVELPAGEVIGALTFSPQGDKAILYTSAAAEDRYHIWDLATDAIDTRSLPKPIESLTVTPGGESLMIWHAQTDAAGADSSSSFYGAVEALSLIDLDNPLRQNNLLLAAAPTAYANSDDGTHGYFIMEGQEKLVAIHYAELVDYEVDLPSVPVHVGVIPDSLWAWANQEHDLGRMSFYYPEADDEDAILQTITGFELNSLID